MHSGVLQSATENVASQGENCVSARHFRQVALCQGLPFPVNIPNAETLEAIRQDQTGEGLIHWRSVDDLMKQAFAYGIFKLALPAEKPLQDAPTFDRKYKGNVLRAALMLQQSCGRVS